MNASGDLENAFDFDRGVAWQHGYADSRSRMPAGVYQRALAFGARRRR